MYRKNNKKANRKIRKYHFFFKLDKLLGKMQGKIIKNTRQM